MTRPDIPIIDIPIIDLSVFEEGDPDRRASLARLVDDTFTRVGFMTIVGHGVPREVVQAGERAARGFFALPLERKLAAVDPDNSRHRGFTPLGAGTVSRPYAGQAAAPDLFEAYVVGRPTPAPDPTEFHLNVWPEEPADFRPALERYYAALEGLALRMLPIFAAALRLRPGFFESYFTSHNSILRVHNYPAQKEPPKPGQLRISPHTDYGAFTILYAKENRAGGLQVRSKEGEWIDVVTSEDSFVINLGDLMHTWTNDRWQSNLHRVINPPHQSVLNVDRVSLPFFVNPNHDALIECLATCVGPGRAPAHPPIRAGEHRLMRLKQANLVTG